MFESILLDVYNPTLPPKGRIPLLWSGLTEQKSSLDAKGRREVDDPYRMSDNLKSYVSASPKRMKSNSNEHGEVKEKKESSRGLEDQRGEKGQLYYCILVYLLPFWLCS